MDPAALAAAGAFGLVAFDAVAVPLAPPRVATGPDALINEWIIWFTTLYLALIVVLALTEKAATLLASRPFRRSPGLHTFGSPGRVNDSTSTQRILGDYHNSDRSAGSA